MGIGFTIDTPARVAHFGINSVVSIIEDHLIENMREVLSRQYGLAYVAIPAESNDSRARRITAYLDLLNVVVQLNKHTRPCCYADQKKKRFNRNACVT